MIQQVPSVKPPETRADLEAMVARRGELQNQLRAIEERRFILGEQSGRVGGEARGRLMERLETLDLRITAIESQLAPLDEAIASAMARPEIMTNVPPGWVIQGPTPGPGEPTAFQGGSISIDGPRFFVNAREVVVAGALTGATLILLGVVAWRLAMRRISSMLASASPDANMGRLQQSVDAIAIEVERISENQRFVTRVLNEHIPALKAGAAEAVRMRAAEQEPVNRA